MKKTLIFVAFLIMCGIALAEEVRVYTNDDLGPSSTNAEKSTLTTEQIREENNRKSDEFWAKKQREEAREINRMSIEIQAKEKERQAKRDRAIKNMNSSLELMEKQRQENKIREIDRKLDDINYKLRGY